MPELIVTNFNRNFTGVSATAAGVVRAHAGRYDLVLAGHPLPGGPAPASLSRARMLSTTAPENRPFVIWHVRRNTEMRAAIWVRDVLRRPVRIVFTSAAIRRHSALPRWLISRMDAVIATSEAAASYVPHVQAVVPHGVDTSVFQPAPDRSAAWAATGFPGTRGIATIGRIRPEKGTDRFVQSMLTLLPACPDLTALVIGRAASGDQSFLKGLQAQVAAAGLADRLLFAGEMDATRLAALVPALSAVVQLPRYEGYGMAPLEGMAAAVPFVATDQGYYRSFSGQGHCGLIVSEQEAEAAGPAISALLDDPERLERMGHRARDTVRTHFSVSREADAIADVYETLWSDAGRTG
ncbi:MAG: glycosyltransferase family 4 protein [Pseudomonadota bacterium]